MMSREKHRQQQYCQIEQQHIRAEYFDTADYPENSHSRTECHSHNRIIQRNMQQSYLKVPQDYLGSAVICIVQHILIAVVEHGSAGLIGDSHTVHEKDEHTQSAGEACAKVHSHFSVHIVEYHQTNKYTKYND